MWARTAANEDHSDCDACPAGTFGDNGYDCFACDDDEYAPEGATACATCPPGSVADATSTGCDVCPAGTYEAEGSCLVCEDGVSLVPGAIACDPCGPGQQPNEDHSDCDACPAGTFGDNGYDCFACDDDEYAPEGATACATCPPGSVVDATSTGCEDCPSDAIVVDGVSCETCPPGATPNAERTVCVTSLDVDAPCAESPTDVDLLGTVTYDVLYDLPHDVWAIGRGMPAIELVDPTTYEISTLADAPSGVLIQRVVPFGDQVLGSREVSFSFDPDKFIVAPYDLADPSQATVHDLLAIPGLGPSPRIAAFDPILVNESSLAYVDMFRVQLVQLDISGPSWTLQNAVAPSPSPPFISRFLGGDGLGLFVTGTLDGKTSAALVNTEDPAAWADGFATRLATWDFPGSVGAGVWDPVDQIAYLTTQDMNWPDAIAGLMAIDTTNPEATPLWQPADPQTPGYANQLSRPVIVGNYVVLVSVDPEELLRATVFERRTLRRVGYVQTTHEPVVPNPNFITVMPTAARGSQVYVGAGYTIGQDVMIDVGACLGL